MDSKTPPDDPGNPSGFSWRTAPQPYHQSTTGPQVLLARKGKGKEVEAELRRPCVDGESPRAGWRSTCCVTQGTGRAEREAALAMVEEISGWHRVTLGADKGYDRRELVQEMREHRQTPHFACKQPVSSISGPPAIRAMRLASASPKRVEGIFGWLNTVGGLRKTRHRGVARVDWVFSVALAAYNLLRMRNLVPALA